MEPKRGITVRSVQIGERQYSADTPVWIFAEADEKSDLVELEVRGQRAFAPRTSVAFSPVPGLSLVELQQRDACFGGPSDWFEVEHEDRGRCFSVLRCKRHGRRFLHDLQGGFAMYERVTLLEADNTASPADIWEQYHRHSTDWLNWLARSR